MKVNIEIRAAEGGDDAKLLVHEQAGLYSAYASLSGLHAAVLDQGPGWLLLQVEGESAAVKPLLAEAGGHRWQRVPPTERKGRVHSSTVTVAVLAPLAESHWVLREEDIDMRFTKDTGPGGQHRNKTESCVVLTHRPTGLQAKAAQRCQHANRRAARELLEARVREHLQAAERRGRERERQSQVGSGQRGDKVRTYSVQHGLVTDHRSGAKAPLKKVLEGRLSLLA